MWNVEQYERFKDERARPFWELTARLAPRPAEIVADLGCGTGELTQTLLERFPGAKVFGVDSSPQMLSQARSRPAITGLEFIQADIGTWTPPSALDVIVSNAALHWLPHHSRVIEHLVSLLKPNGTVAVQIPANFDQPTHTCAAELAQTPQWIERIKPLSPPPPPSLDWYVRSLWGLGCKHIDAWTTTYHHILQGTDAVLEWIKGSVLRPILNQLSPPDSELFLKQLSKKLQEAYPPGDRGTILPYRRMFFVATRS